MSRNVENIHGVSEIGHLKTDSLRKFAALVAEVDTDNDDHFRFVISTAIQNFQITPGELADTFGVNRATVSRWKAGKNLPHRMARPTVINWIQTRVSQIADQEDKALQHCLEVVR